MAECSRSSTPRAKLRTTEAEAGAAKAQRVDDHLEIRLLGPVAALRAGVSVDLRGRKPRALLARLALDPGTVLSVDRIVEDLWPAGAPETAAHAVQVYVSQLRTALGSAAIERGAAGYALGVDRKQIDARRFEHLADEGRAALQDGDVRTSHGALREALELWRGPALSDFVYEPFAQLEIARLEELRLVALECRIDADLALGRHAEVVAELEALVEAHPLREGPLRRLMLALYRCGHQVDALAAYRRARGALVAELGIEPGPELRELEAAILRQDESLLPDRPAPAAMQFRRLVTVLVANVFVSPVSGEGVDAEAAAPLIRRALDAAAGAVTRHRGTVQPATGDAIAAVFGIPASHEDDALRAVGTALDIRAELTALNAGPRAEAPAVAASIGVETGEVVTAPQHTRGQLLTGEVVNVAAKLADAAAPNEIVVGSLAGRLVDHAAVLEPLGELDVGPRRDGVRGYRLVEIAPAASAFERRVDAPFVGRRRELATLRSALRSAIANEAAEAALIVGPAGVGKSRLADEFARRASGVTVLYGRCLPYGDGITYLPLREALDSADQSEQRRTLLQALESDTPSPAGEIALEFRRFCGELARQRPLVLVFDDVQWAEPAFLDLAVGVAAKSASRILVLFLAREELLVERADAIEARRIVLDGLSQDETDAVLDGLGGGALASDQRARIVETAEGNPLFLEQLVALALEGRGGRGLPETIQALLAARLDRLGPGERAVLERASVVGKHFSVDDVAALIDGAAAETARPNLESLSKRGFLRRQNDNSFAFRHVVLQQAVYRAAPKKVRAELHRRFADRLVEESGHSAELDELAGYHFEQAYRLKEEIRQVDEVAQRLGEEAGRRLGSAGIRALQRGDMHAALNLLTRGTALPARDQAHRRELLCELALARVAADDLEGAGRVLADVVAQARGAGDERTEMRARIEQEYVRLRREPQRTADHLLNAITDGVPTFERSRDRRALGRAWLLRGFVEGGQRGDHQAWQEAAERALAHYKAARWPLSTCVGEIAAALYWGPAPIDDAARRCELLLSDERLDLPGAAYLRAFLGGLVAQRHEFERARELTRSSRATLEELGMHAAAQTYCMPVLADIEMLAGDASAAETILSDLCDRLVKAGDFSHLASRAGDLAEALLQLARVEEADDWTRVAERHAAPDDPDAQMWRSVRARINVRTGDLDVATALASEAVRLGEQTDALNRRAKAELALGEVLRAAQDVAGAASAFGRAIELYEQKGNVVGAAHVRAVAGQHVTA